MYVQCMVGFVMGSRHHTIFNMKSLEFIQDNYFQRHIRVNKVGMRKFVQKG